MNKIYPLYLAKELVIEKCISLKLGYVSHEIKEFNGKNNWVITYKCNKHGEKETTWGSMRRIHGCKECSKEKRKPQGIKCEFCGISSDKEKIITTTRFGRTQQFCCAHYYQMVRHGGISRTPRWRNEIIEYKDHLEIVLYDREQNEIGRTKISKQHRLLIEKYKWYRKIYPNRHSDYAMSTDKNGKPIRLHNIIAEVILGKKPIGKTVDHLNRDGLDNRDENLVYKDQTEQNYNQKIRNDNKSGVKGVCSHQGKYWLAQIRYKHIKLCKNFTSFQKAVEKRKYWEKLIEQGAYELLEMEKSK